MADRLTARCGTSHRIDDQQATIEQRLKIFHNQTLSVLDFYERKNRAIVDVSSSSGPVLSFSVLLDRLGITGRGTFPRSERTSRSTSLEKRCFGRVDDQCFAFPLAFLLLDLERKTSLKMFV